MPVLEHGDPTGERLYQIQRDEPWHGNEYGGNTEQDAAERAKCPHRDHTRRPEEHHARDGCREVQQPNPYEHAPVPPAGAEAFARRHGIAVAGPDDAFDECALTDKTHDDGRGDRQDDHDSHGRDVGHLEIPEAADADGYASSADGPATVAASTTAARAAAREADEEPEQPERFARTGVMQPLSDDLLYGHARLPVSR